MRYSTGTGWSIGPAGAATRPRAPPSPGPCRPTISGALTIKGEFTLVDRRYCYPLTITDAASRYLLGCEALSSTNRADAFAVFERVFKEYGLPGAIRTDNGTPVARGNSLFGLTRLSVWWLRLGIGLERIKPGNPQQNGRHERI